jgi:dTDP-D-glucose 4,6-dehydratase
LFVIAIFTDGIITIYGDGKHVKDILYLVEAFDKFLRSNLKHEVFKVGRDLKNTLSKSFRYTLSISF